MPGALKLPSVFNQREAGTGSCISCPEWRKQKRHTAHSMIDAGSPGAGMRAQSWHFTAHTASTAPLQNCPSMCFPRLPQILHESANCSLILASLER